MSPELIAIIGVGIALLTVQIAIAGLLVTLMLQSEKRTNQRLDRLEDRVIREIQLFRAEVNQRFERQEAETKRQFERQEDQIGQRFGEVKEQFAALDEQVRGLERGQARLAAELSLLKDFFTHFLQRERE